MDESLVFQRVELTEIHGLRERVLTPGHPGRPVVWPYDETALHFGAFEEERLVGCVSVTAEPMPGRAATNPYHLHSMAVELGEQGEGVGSWMLDQVTSYLEAHGCDIVWATSRLSAVPFYERHGFGVGESFEIEPTHATMRYVWLVL
jgi:GNAT superfamily N-acetyltransferase